MSINQKNLQIFATKIYKTKVDLGTKIMKDTFHFTQNPCKLRNDPELQRRRNRTVYLRTESISLLAPKLWGLIPSTNRNANSLGKFKDPLSGLRQYFFLRYLNFCLDFLIMWKNGFIRKIRLILKFLTSQPG